MFKIHCIGIVKDFIVPLIQEIIMMIIISVLITIIKAPSKARLV